VPFVLLAVMMVVQFGLAFYARQVLSGATRDGAAAAARRGSSAGEGAAVTAKLIDGSGGTLFAARPQTTPSVSGNTVTITSSGQVVSLMPFFGNITVKASSSASLETFNPQGENP
jgi:Flp pilus assembly protein TadG